jgi:hypothetical protein
MDHDRNAGVLGAFTSEDRAAVATDVDGCAWKDAPAVR